MRDLPCVVVPGGVTLPPEHGEDAGAVQTLGARFAHGMVSLSEAADLGCRACASPGRRLPISRHGGDVASRRRGARAVAAALGARASGQPVWLDMARRSARALHHLEARKIAMRDILTPASIQNAMVVHAAFGGSTNLLLHIPAIAHAAGLKPPTVEDWIAVNRRVPRLVSVLPNGPVHHPTVRVFLAGGVPEVMLHLRRLNCWTRRAHCFRQNLGRKSGLVGRIRTAPPFREFLRQHDGVDADDVILSARTARERGMGRHADFSPRQSRAGRFGREGRRD